MCAYQAKAQASANMGTIASIAPKVSILANLDMVLPYASLIALMRFTIFPNPAPPCEHCSKSSQVPSNGNALVAHFHVTDKSSNQLDSGLTSQFDL